jgi:SSS family solute:Na+ symporter
LAHIDYAIVAFYLIGITLFGLYLSRRATSSDSFFLASRKATWPVIGLSLLASNISSTTLVGLAGAAYSNGISVYDYEWTAAVILVFFCIFFIPFLLRSQVYTLPEFLERRFNGFARSYFSCITLFLNVALNGASALYCGALLFKLLLPHVPIWQIVLVEALSAGLYTIAGGLRSVIYTEVIQAILLLTASVIISFTSFARAGGWEAVMQNVDPAKLSLIRPASDPAMPWPGLVVGVPLLGFYYWCANQAMVQRVLSAKDENHGRWGCLLTGALKLPVLFLMVLPGSAATLIYPNLPRDDMVYPQLLFGLLPAGMVGLTMAGFLSAMMSSIASSLNASATLFTMDFVRRWRPGLGGHDLVRVSRLVTLGLAALAVAWAPQIERFGSLWQYVQGVLAYVVPPITALYLIGLFWKRANSKGATACLLAGMAGGLGLFFANLVLHLVHVQFLYVAPILFVLCSAALVVVSLATQADPPGKTNGLLWTPAFFRAESELLAGQSLWRNYRILGLALLAVTAVVVWRFR